MEAARALGIHGSFFPGDARFSEDALPVWIDHGDRLMYGIPGNQWRGFKVADVYLAPFSAAEACGPATR